MIGFELTVYFVVFAHDRVKIKILGNTDAYAHSGCYLRRFG